MLKVKVPGGVRRVDPTWVWGRHCSGYQQGRQAPRPEPWERPSFTGSAEAPLAFRRADEVGNSPHGSDAEGAAVGLPTADVGRTLMYVYVVDAAANVAAG